MALTPRIDNLESNIIINGGMDYWQRNNTGATQTLSAIEYNCVDRFGVNRQTGVANSGNLNLTRQGDVPTFAESGFRFNNSVRIRCNQAYAVADPQFHAFEHRVEGNILQAVRDGKFVFSFWAKSNKLGTYHVSLNNSAGNVYNILPFVVSQSLVWTKYTFVVDMGSAPGTWLTDAGLGLRIAWVLHATAEKKGVVPTEAWFTPVGGVFFSTTQVNFMDSTSNDIFITGVMIKPIKETISNPESVRFSRAGDNLADELVLCQRYYEKSYDTNIAPGTPTTDAGGIFFRAALTATQTFGSVIFTCKKRNTPTITVYSIVTGTSGVIRNVVAGTDVAATTFNIGQTAFTVASNASVTDQQAITFQYAADAEL